MPVLTDKEGKEIVEIALDRELDAFSMDADFYDDYDMDSLGTVALTVEVQKRYGVRISDDAAPRIRTGRRLRAFLEGLSEQERVRT